MPPSAPPFLSHDGGAQASEDAALVRLLGLLAERGYRFVTPTPATHARVLARPGRRQARSLADVLGWSLPFTPGLLPAAIEDALDAAGMIARNGVRAAARLRVSSLHERLYLHSAYPTAERDAVFLGPDSYRFADLIVAEMAEAPPPARAVDIGTGAGVGALTIAGRAPDAAVTMTDLNPAALRLARLNAAAAGLAIAAHEAAGFDGIDGRFDLITINPPYIADDAGRAYRDGGAMHGAGLSLALARDAMARLAPGGRLILYTGSAIVDGVDRLHAALAASADSAACALRYREIDPDVFGEELDQPAYAEVDRIALVAAVATRPA